MKLKKLVLGITLLFSCIVLAQEKGDFSGFVGVTYPLVSGSDIGANAGVVYLFTEALAAAPSFSYYFTPSGFTSTAINLDARYYLGGDESLKYFGLAGVSFLSTKVTGFGAVSDTGFNVGGGLIYELGESFGLLAQVKYGSGGAGAVEPMVGIHFNF
ncbi:hypothetical protein [Polaribacter sp.]|uniref:hypothetical protein n=1 Tax=Polaribacter sp. TaxID=1920175 RepID=UPI003EF4B48A